MDVVYVFRHSQFQDLELRYSLRSVAKYLPWIRKVWIFGDRPEFLSDEWSAIEHIPWEAVAWFGHHQIPVKNHFLQYYLLSLWPELDVEFLIFHDDHILLEYLPEEIGTRNRYLEDKSQVKSGGQEECREQLRRSFDWLRERGYPTFNFESHTPWHMTKRRLFQTFKTFQEFISEERYGGMVAPSAILNYAAKHERIPITQRDDENLTQGFVVDPPRYDEIVQKTAGKKYLFFDEGAFSTGMRRFLAERFPEPCVYETRVTVPELPRYDVVYLMARSKWDQELKYSLRSLERYFRQLGKVWIIGHLPEFIDPTTVVHLPQTNFLQNGIFVESAAMRLLNEQLEGLTEDFILAQDDNYLLRPATIEDFGPLLVEDLDCVQIRGTKPWQLMLWRTYDLLKFLERTAFNYEAHTPIRFNRTKLRDIARIFIGTESAAKRRYHGVCIRMAYWNILGVDSAAIRPVADYRVGFTQPSHAATVEQIQSRLTDRLFLFHNDDGLTDAMKAVLAATYPQKSRFERSHVSNS